MQAKLIHTIRIGQDSEEVRAKLLVVSFALQELSKGEGNGRPKIFKTKYLALKMSADIWGKSVWECDKCKQQFPAYGRLRRHKVNSHAY